MSSMKFAQFATYLNHLEETASRLEMTEQLAELFLALDESELQPAIYLMQGSLVAEYQSLEFQMSSKMVLRALAAFYAADSTDQSEPATQEALFSDDEAVAAEYEQSLAAVTQLYKKKGDVGIVAEQLLATHLESGTNDLSISEVHAKLTEIAVAAGAGSQQVKVDQLEAIVSNVAPLSARYITRMVIGKLRLGFSTKTILDALSWAVTGDKSESSFLEKLYQRKADVGSLAVQYLKLKDASKDERKQRLDQQVEVEVGVPVVPALCQRLNTAQEIIEKMGEIIIEPKYDGLRVQIHFDASKKEGQRFTVFTRSLDDITHMFPELQDISSRMQVDSCILDGEAIGYDPETGGLLPFQKTITRRRKHDISQQASEVPIRFYIFDVLFLNGESLLNKKLRARKDLFASVIDDNEVILDTPYLITNSAEKTRTSHQQYLADGLEGAVMKQVDSYYVSGRKGWNWVKIKEAEGTTGKLTDTLDCIVMGYYYGRGKRAQFGIGALLVGVLDTDEDSIKTIAKIGTGLSEDQLQAMKQKCDAVSVDTKPDSYIVDKQLFADVWCHPEIVIEVAADELTNSPTHSAQKALRFPRMLKLRDDKTWQQATTIKELEGISVAQ